MFKKIGKWLALKALPLIIDNLVFKAKTIEKSDGFYINIFMSAFDFTIVDTDIKLSSQSTAGITKNEVLKLDKPINVTRTNQLDPFGNLDRIQRKMSRNANEDLREAA